MRIKYNCKICYEYIVFYFAGCSRDEEKRTEKGGEDDGVVNVF